jgi:hypothetical protein
MKHTYKIDVAGVSTVIAPDLGVNDAPDFAVGAVLQGDYVRGTNGFIYWAVNAGTAVTSPTHKHGIETVDGIQWLLLPNARHLIISADESGNAFLAKNNTAILNEGVRLDAYRPIWDLDMFIGSVSAISDTSVTLAIEHSG